MGVFDSLFADNPNDAAYLALASGLLSGKGSFNSILGNSLAGAQGAYSGAADRGLKNQMTKMQIEEMAKRLKQQEQAQADQEQFRQSLLSQGSPQTQAAQQALAGGGGPTLANAAKMPAVDPMQSMMYRALETRQVSPLDFMKLTQKDNTPIAVPEGTSLLDRVTKKPIYSNAKTEKPEKAPAGFRYGPDGSLVVDPEWFRVQKELRVAGRASSEAAPPGSETSDDAIDAAAARYNVDGTLPPLGIGKTGVAIRAKVLNRAAELAKSAGTNPTDQRVGHLDAKAAASALMDLSKREANVGAFERNFKRNADLAFEYSAKVDRTGVPIVNKWIQAGKRAITGDPDLSAFDLAIKTAVNEYAKIISGSMGNTVLAEGEIKKVEGLLNAAQKPEQVAEIISLMKRETQNRMIGFKEEKDQLKKRISGPSSPGGKAVQTATNPKTGEKLMLKDGKWVPFQ